MNKSQRIYLNTGTTITDKHIIVQLEQEIDTLEFMTLNISTKDAYQNFNADYGVLVGRVLANGGVGIPNAKISIFIPLTDTDAENGDISSIYPYKTPRDVNAQGKRYNLLPRVSQIDPNTNLAVPKQAFGSFPIKPEIVANQTFLDVYKKYYKYTTVTNNSGDYMIFGVPIGTQTVHLSVDTTDIGKYSMTPATFVTSLGFSSNLFTDNNTRIKPSSDLKDLPNIETQEISVDIIPFWGDTTNFTIGITRQDFRVRATLVNTFIIFGSAFTDGSNSMWSQYDDSNQSYIAQVDELHHIRGNISGEPSNLLMESKRIGIISEKIYYYSDKYTDDEINSGSVDSTNMLLLDKTEYTTYKQNGDFVFIISCNRHKIITDDLGNDVEVLSSNPNGINTQFRGFVTFEISTDNVPLNISEDIGGNHEATVQKAKRYIFKIPQVANVEHSFIIDDNNVDTVNWRKEHKIFSGGTIYSVAKFNPMIQNKDSHKNVDPSAFNYQLTAGGGFLQTDYINTLYDINGNALDNNYNVGIIQLSGGTNDLPANISNTNGNFFGGNWLNFSLYFPQVGLFEEGLPTWFGPHVKYQRGIFSTSHYTQNFYLVQADGTPNYDVMKYYFPGENTNTQPIAAGDVNTFGFARSDLHYSDFIVVDKADINKFNNITTKGFKKSTIDESFYKGKYRNATYVPPDWSSFPACPLNGGRDYTHNTNDVDTNFYFYKGYGDSDCIKFLVSLGILT